MRKTRTKLLILLSCLIFGALPGCSRDLEEPGVVARVNGAPITLSQLEFVTDLMHIDEQPDANPTLEQLKKEHGKALADLIVQQLIYQDLEKRGLEVTKQEMQKAEDQVRADYPDGAFEEMLVEEYIDLAAWREQLHARLAMEKFNEQVLRPKISIDYQEAEQYYKDNVNDFYLPPRISMVLIAGPGRELVEKATEAYQHGEEPEAIVARLSTVTVRRIKLREDRMPSAWREALKGLGKDGVSPAWTDKMGVSRIILLERIPSKLLDASQAYPLVEKILVEKKMSKAFDHWLSERLAKADIRVNAQLLRDEEEKANQEQQDKVAETEKILLESPQAPGAGAAEGTSAGSGDEAAGEQNVPGAQDSADQAKAAAPSKGARHAAKDSGAAAEQKLTPELSPQDIAPPEVMEQERHRSAPSGEEEVPAPAPSKRSKRGKAKQGHPADSGE
ncbi:hypothetical protein dsx2_0256 [Desulfovibrio sp. X2]|uniref:SurA N-terminal domain-containing protein n=1 Tax=Desulfovibrio sp. X2 TaxID=941449 RepID=UPI000358CC91|nr:SurA N-terminal domain-containing protein [Desulfovibrio sp. X2]EPR42329.1 hypothetical protein dsx2_0256 [Desulfovibrio sp. X2]